MDSYFWWSVIALSGFVLCVRCYRHAKRSDAFGWEMVWIFCAAYQFILLISEIVPLIAMLWKGAK